MPDESMGSIIESHRYASIETDLSHQDEKREDRISVVCYDVIKICCEEINSGIKAIKVSKTHKADQPHGKAQLDTRGEKKEKQNNACNAHHSLIHIHPSRSLR